MIPLPWFIIAVLLTALVSGGGAFLKGESAGADRVQSAWDRAELSTQDARAVRIARAAAVSKTLQDAIDDGRRKEREDRDRREHQLSADLASLRNRAARPEPGLHGDVPPVAGPGPAELAAGGRGTGAGLFRDDAEFLVRLARAAQLARTERDACYRAYNAGRAALDAVN